MSKVVQRKELEGFFLFVTSRCNSKCRTCFDHDKLDDGRDLTFAQLESLSRTAPRFDKLYLSGGEPTLREDLVEIVELFYANNGIKLVNFPTTGLLPERAERMVARLLDDCPKLEGHLNFSSTESAAPRIPAIVSAGWTGLGAERASPNVLFVNELDHQLLFPRVAAVTHHGGSGTTHTAARAGVPQLVLPQIADPYFGGHRVWVLGLGPPAVPVKRLTAARLVRALDRLRLHGDDDGRAAAVGAILRREKSTNAAVATIEALVEGGQRGRYRRGATSCRPSLESAA